MGKKDKAAATGELSKKQRKALEAREAELRAELERRAAKKAAKKLDKKKSKKHAEAIATKVDAETPVAETDETRAAYAAAVAERKSSAKAKTIAAAEQVIATPSSEGATDAAKLAHAAATEAGDDETDEQIRERIAAKRVRRQELVELAGSIDRDNVEAVRAYNAELATLGGGTFLTSNAEREKEAARLSGSTAPIETATKPSEPEQTAVEVETDHGREFQVGTVTSVEGTTGEDLPGVNFAKPSEAPKTDFATNGNGQYIIQRPSDGKEVGYTRVTTYIDNLEDKTKLTEWKLRILLEGVALNDTPDQDGKLPEPVVAQIRDLIHRRDVAIAKARKADRKGKLAPGELATYVDGAWSDFKRAVNTLVSELLDLGGVHEKAQKGTDIHALTELYDREGIDAVGQLLTDGKITPADLRDVEAYAAAIERAGIRIVPEHIEQVIVNDELKVAGRLDRVALVKFPGAQRAVRCVVDIKTGRVDYATGKIAQQLEMYSSGVGYDLNTHERTDLKLSRTKAVLVHVPAGTGTATVHPVDLTLGRKGNHLSGQVRAWRNEGKRAIDLKTDMAVATEAGAS